MRAYIHHFHRQPEASSDEAANWIASFRLICHLPAATRMDRKDHVAHIRVHWASDIHAVFGHKPDNGASRNGPVASHSYACGLFKSWREHGGTSSSCGNSRCFEAIKEPLTQTEAKDEIYSRCHLVSQAMQLAHLAERLHAPGCHVSLQRRSFYCALGGPFASSLRLGSQHPELSVRAPADVTPTSSVYG